MVDESNNDLRICHNPLFSLFQILGEASKRNCEFPDHSTPACLPEHPHCGFTCSDGFTASYDPPACVCNAPSVVCNGVCQQSGPCASARASTEKKKRWVGSGACSEKGPEWAACGVYGGRAHAWECVNTARDLESCTCSPLTLGVFVSVILTASSMLVPACCKNRWWLRYSSHALLSCRKRLLCDSRCFRRRMSVWRMHRLSLSPRIRALA